MFNSGLSKFARLVLATLFVALTAFGHFSDLSRRDQATERGPVSESVAGSAMQIAQWESSRAAPFSTDHGAGDVCFSGCGCCSTAALADRGPDLSPRLSAPAALLLPETRWPSPNWPDQPFKPPRLIG